MTDRHVDPETLAADVEPPALPRPRWRAMFAGAAAIAAGLIVWIGLRPAEVAQGPAAIRGSVVVESGPDALRGGAGGLYHFEISIDRPAHLVIVAAEEASASIVYPHPNPHFGMFGRTSPFPAGQTARIPPLPVADYAAASVTPDAVFLASPIPAILAPEALAKLRADLDAAAPSGPGAVRDLLRTRFGSVVDLPRR